MTRVRAPLKSVRTWIALDGGRGSASRLRSRRCARFRVAWARVLVWVYGRVREDHVRALSRASLNLKSLMTDGPPKDLVVSALTDLAKAGFPQIFDEHLAVPLFQTGMYLRPDRAHANSTSPLVPQLREAAHEAIAADPVMKVLTDAPTEHDHGVFVQDSSGMGWRLHPAEVVPVLQCLAAQHVVAKNAPTDVVDSLIHETEDLVRRLRELLAGRESVALTRVAYEGIDLKENVRLEFSWGVLRCATAAERKMVPFGSKGPAVILEHWFPVALVVYEPAKADEKGSEPKLPIGPDAFNLLSAGWFRHGGRRWCRSSPG